MFTVTWDEPLFGFIHFIRQNYHVHCDTWEDACRVASVIENYGRNVTIERR